MNTNQHGYLDSVELRQGEKFMVYRMPRADGAYDILVIETPRFMNMYNHEELRRYIGYTDIRNIPGISECQVHFIPFGNETKMLLRPPPQ